MQDFNGNPDLLRPVEALGLRARALKALHDEGILYIGQLPVFSKWELQFVPQLGPVSAKRIEEQMSNIGIPLASKDDVSEELVELKRVLRRLPESPEDAIAVLRVAYEIPDNVQVPEGPIQDSVRKATFELNVPSHMSREDLRGLLKNPKLLARLQAVFDTHATGQSLERAAGETRKANGIAAARPHEQPAL